jgi:hypothetical protein
MTSGSPSEADEICAILGYYEVYSGNSLETFRDKISGPAFKDQEIKGDGTDRLSRKVGKELYHYMLGNILE